MIAWFSGGSGDESMLGLAVTVSDPLETRQRVIGSTSNVEEFEKNGLCSVLAPGTAGRPDDYAAGQRLPDDRIQKQPPSPPYPSIRSNGNPTSPPKAGSLRFTTFATESLA